MVTAIALLLAVLLDYRLGEPARFHPLVGFGCCADKIERRFNRAGNGSRLMGGLAVLLCIVPALLASSWLWWWSLKNYSLLAIVVGGVGLYFTLGWRSLVQHVAAVQVALETPDLVKARTAVARIVSRDCEQADTLQVRRAALTAGARARGAGSGARRRLVWRDRTATMVTWQGRGGALSTGGWCGLSTSRTRGEGKPVDSAAGSPPALNRPPTRHSGARGERESAPRCGVP